MRYEARWSEELVMRVLFQHHPLLANDGVLYDGSIERRIRHADAAAAERAIGGYVCVNDVTCRDWQFRTREWLQGKSWEATTPLGPYLVTPDELPGGVRPELQVRLSVDGAVMQSDTTADLLFDPVALVSYLSTMVTLRPGALGAPLYIEYDPPVRRGLSFAATGPGLPSPITRPSCRGSRFLA